MREKRSRNKPNREWHQTEKRQCYTVMFQIHSRDCDKEQIRDGCESETVQWIQTQGEIWNGHATNNGCKMLETAWDVN